MKFLQSISLLFFFTGTAHSEQAVQAEGLDRVQLKGTVTDANTGRPLAFRLYIQSEDGTFHHARSSSAEGTAVEYHVTRLTSKEIHTTLSAHPFQTALSRGQYTLTILRGKEYIPFRTKVELKENPVELNIKLRRWIDMAATGWFSGETHVHRRISELSNVMLAEDLNVAFPLTYWVTDSRESPARTNHNREIIPPAELVQLDPTHVYWPINTEYEIFSIDGRRHTLGAIFFLNHRTAIDATAPPISQAVTIARKEHALLELDKHNWPWSMMLIPVAEVDLYELTNNHIWRDSFLFKNWYPEYVADWMNIELDNNGHFTERGWIDFGLQTYYMLLNCGYQLRPTAGTASGVHPVPLGFGRVYVQVDSPFQYDRWVEGLNQGRSFVTTGPMLTVEFNGQHPGHLFQSKHESSLTVQITGEAKSLAPLDTIEIVVNGRVAKTIIPQNAALPAGGFQTSLNDNLLVKQSSWIAVRCFLQNEEGRPRFAHTGPVHIEVPNRPLRPRSEEVDYLISRLQREIDRHRGVLFDEAMAEFEQAIKAFQVLDRAVTCPGE